MKIDKLIQEIIQNARSDRARLESLAKTLDTAIKMGGEEDPLAKMALTEHFTSVSDSLTKINQQLVELVKIESKSQEKTPSDGKMGSEEREDLFDEIENPPQEDQAEEDERNGE